jgi:ribosomal protein S27AE
MDYFQKLLKTRQEGITLKRPKRPSNFDANDKSTWTNKCLECEAKMVYIDSEHDPRYLCQKCGNVLEV